MNVLLDGKCVKYMVLSAHNSPIFRLVVLGGSVYTGHSTNKTNLQI